MQRGRSAHPRKLASSGTVSGGIASGGTQASGPSNASSALQSGRGGAGGRLREEKRVGLLSHLLAGGAGAGGTARELVRGVPRVT